MAIYVRLCARCGRPFQAKTHRRRFCAGFCFRENEREGERRRRAQWSPERKRAAILVGCARQSRRLIPQPCEVCGTRKQIDAHHDDYSKPLDVRWLCRSHHRQHHADLARKA